MMTIIAPGKVVLVRWNILKNLTDSTEHFIGLDRTLGLGRMSAAIIKFDEEPGVGETFSGSTYKTLGDPRHIHMDAQYVLDRVLASRDIKYEWKYQQGGRDE